MHACRRMYLCSGGSRGGKSIHGPPSKLAVEFGPLRGRKSNDIIVNLPTSNDFAPPYRCRLRIWPPYGKIRLKKGHQKFWEIDENFGGNAELFSGTPKKGRSKM